MAGNLTDQLRRAIRKSRFSQNQIAQAAGVDRSVLTRFLHGQRQLRLCTYERVASEVGCKLTLGFVKK